MNREHEDLQDDQPLIELARQGDLAAYDELVRRYHGRIYGLLVNMTHNREDAEDLAQEVFVKAFDALSKYKGKSSFYTWIYRIAVNRGINFIKKRKRRSAFSIDDVDLAIERDPAFVELSSRESPSRDATVSELNKKLNAALDTLSEKHRAVVVMHDIQGLPHDRIAEIVKASPGTVRSRLFYARQQLQAQLSEYIA